MQRRTIATVLLAVLLAFAGCSSGPGGTTAPNATDAPATNGGGTGLPSALPPGVNETGLADASTLVDAHLASLNGTTYRFALAGGTATANQSAETTYDVAVGADHTLVSKESASADTTAWRNGSYALHRQSAGESVRYGAFAGPVRTGVEDPRRLQRLLVNYLHAASFDASATTHEGTEHVELTAASANETFWGESNVTSLDVSVLVSPDGRIDRFAFSATVNRSGSQATVDLDYRLDAVGDVAPERPAWTDEVPQVRTSLVGDGDVLAIRNTGGSPAPANSTLTVAVSDAQGGVTLPAELAPGETVYVTAARNGSALNATVHATKPSEGTYDFSSSDRVLVVGRLGDTVARLLLTPQ